MDSTKHGCFYLLNLGFSVESWQLLASLDCLLYRTLNRNASNAWVAQILKSTGINIDDKLKYSSISKSLLILSVTLLKQNSKCLDCNPLASCQWMLTS